MRAAAVVGMVLLCGIAQGAQPKTVTNTIGMVLIDIPAGKFTMGEGAVAVTLTKPFWLGKTEVPQGQWQAVMGTEPWKGYEEIKIGKDFAASYVDWNDATAFCQKLTDLERKAGKLKANEEYRLPTEAEWEYACRAGTTTAYSFGDDKKQLGNYGWFQGNALRIGENYAHPVSRKQPNPWGLYDMHGNVYEWCSDWYDETRFYGTDPVGLEEGSGRVFRGGSWWNGPDGCRSASRHYVVPSYRLYNLGFRVARSQSAQ
ncbi:MAG: formylglycine-generating enzyme family protein [Planctomycetota bacterium]|jgi:formylglycine-generating enzyme required for sulfatase activity|nr:MAG: formylglycine-generating enzyme family protein [Planctomycetota bacterium]